MMVGGARKFYTHSDVPVEIMEDTSCVEAILSHLEMDAERAFGAMSLPVVWYKVIGRSIPDPVNAFERSVYRVQIGLDLDELARYCDAHPNRTF